MPTGTGNLMTEWVPDTVQPLYIFSLVITAVVVPLGGCEFGEPDNSRDPCEPPTAAVLRERLSRSSAAISGVLERRVVVTDSVTTTEGLILRVSATLAGPDVPARVALWADVSTPDRRFLADGATVVAFVRRHDAATTTAAGEPVAGYEFGTANGLLVVEGGRVRSQCRASTSEPVDASILDTLSEK